MPKAIVLIAVLVCVLLSVKPLNGEEKTGDRENPVPVTAESLDRGRFLYQQHCTACHGADGRARVDVVSDATDLTDPDAYYSGASEAEIFNSIRNGAGLSMPPWSFQITDDRDIWHLVNFIESLWLQDKENT